jgi:hypothetical protein
MPVQVNDPETVQGQPAGPEEGPDLHLRCRGVFAGLVPGSGKSVMAVGPLARLNAPGLLATLDRYPYGCTEQMTSAPCRCSISTIVARAMDLKGAEDLRGGSTKPSSRS